VTKRILKDVYGEQEMSPAPCSASGERLVNLRDPAVYRGVLDRANIRCRLVDVGPDMKGYLAGTYQIYERDRLLISLPQFHAVRSWQNVWDLTQVHRGVGDHLGRLPCRLPHDLPPHEGARRHRHERSVGLQPHLPTATPPAPRPRHCSTPSWPIRAPPWAGRKPSHWMIISSIASGNGPRARPARAGPHGHMAGIRNDIAKTNAVHLTRCWSCIATYGSTSSMATGPIWASTCTWPRIIPMCT